MGKIRYQTIPNQFQTAELLGRIDADHKLAREQKMNLSPEAIRSKAQVRNFIAAHGGCQKTECSSI